MECEFIPSHGIDSFLKLRVLFSLHQLPSHSATLQELSERLFVGDSALLQQTVADLACHGLVQSTAERCTLDEQPEIAYCLRCLTKTFDDPWARQGLLDWIAAAHSRCTPRDNAHDAD